MSGVLKRMRKQLFAVLLLLVICFIYLAFNSKYAFKQIIKFTSGETKVQDKKRFKFQTFNKRNLQGYGNPASYQRLLLQMYNFPAKNFVKVDDKMADEYFIENEEKLLADPPLVKIEDISNPKYSVLTTKRVYYVLGETIDILIQMNNGYQKPKTRGGDDVRVWMANSDSSCAAEVTDLNNGTYRARLKALWSGEASIQAALAFSREEARVLLDNRRKLKVMRYSIAKYAKNEDSGELTFCSPFSDIPLVHDVCNFTKLNSNPYYCGVPYSHNLNCSDWKEVYTVRYSKQVMTTQERKLLSRKSRLIMFKDSITVHIENGPMINLPNCSHIKKSLTWTDTAPRGHFKKHIWYPSYCQRTITPRSLRRCITNTTITLIGDSTVRQWYESIIKITNCSNDIYDSVSKTKRSGRRCLDKELNYKVTFGLHGFPYSVANSMDAIANIISFQKRLEAIHVQGKHFVILHMYLHFLFFHTSIFVSQVRSLRDTIVNLLKKEPHVKIAIKGPHAFYDADNKPIVKNDYLGKVYIHILKTELFELRDRIWFMDFWDMSVSAKNYPIHPAKWFVNENVKLFFDYVC
ncbi:NXPE family member 4 isoform X1 [Patella vulgata]|uniref:NXPE family member 4 isoform X1 n=2 Tax=Patella vulgata TaxID=6465 RepID=UPI002180360D|nr:NXPE family member 4 isoform X1 [Patella vulgata]